MKRSLQLALAVMSGITVCLSFPARIGSLHVPEMGWLAWVALVPLITAIRKAPPRRAFLITFVSAAVWYAGSLFWVFRAMHTFGRLPVVASVLVLVLLVVVVAAFIALAPCVARLIETRWRGEGIVWLAVCWTGMEILRNYGPCNGFPWSNVAMSQWRLLPLIQIVDVVGTFGLCFLIVWVNAFLAELLARYGGEPVRYLVAKGVVTALLCAATVGYGLWSLHAIPPTLAKEPSLSIGIVQGNIPQEEKWSKAMAGNNLEVHREGARRLLEAGVEVIVWPEASFPWPIRTTDETIDPRALGFSSKESIDFPYTLLGAVSETDDDNFYNSALLFSGDGGIVGRYHKMHLVPFGEYVPYKKMLFFAKKLTQPVGNFLAGTSAEPLVAGAARLGILICYEDIFPEVARRTVRAGAQVLVNLTNDAWYGVSSAPYQHLAMSVFRAVETRRFLVRATNSGVSAVVMPTGEVMVESDIFTPALIVSPLVLLESLTPYVRLGDWFAWACLAYMVIGLGAVAAESIRRRKGRPLAGSDARRQEKSTTPV